MCFIEYIINLFKANNNREDTVDIEINNNAGQKIAEIDSLNNEKESLIECKISPINIEISSPVKSRYKIEYNGDTILYDSISRLFHVYYLAKFQNDLIIFYNKPRLPLEGWFQFCMQCSVTTGQLHFYENFGKNNLFVRICYNCSRDFTKHPETLDNLFLKKQIEECKKYIKI